MKKAIILISMCFCVGLVSAQGSFPVDDSKESYTLRFGYLSYNDILKSMPEYNQAMQSIEDLRATYDQEMARAEQEFSKKFAEYVDGQKSFPENIMLKRQKELQQLMEQSMQFKKEAQELLTDAEAELLAPVNAKLQEAISAVGKQRNYAYVLNTDANAYPYISDGAEDCTDAVLTQLGVK